VSNPFRAGIPYPEEELREVFREAATATYEPDPRGDLRAREAVSETWENRGLRVGPDRIVLCASTSEGYAWLFKVLADPGDEILSFHPAYPLLDYLGRLDGLSLGSVSLAREHGHWSTESGVSELNARFEARREPAGSPRAAALVLVSPNNPTGSYVREREAMALAALAIRHDLPLVVDEVFGTFPVDGPAPRSRHGNDPDAPVTFLGADDVPLVVLDGLSKSAGLPGLKLGWMAVFGPASFREELLARLEVVADTWLSVGTPVQRALPRLLGLGAPVADAIRERIRGNMATLRGLLPPFGPCELLPVEGGWNAVLRLPRLMTEEEWALRLLEDEGVLLQPGWFYDFDSESWLIASLLTPETELAEGFGRLLTLVEASL
jgi:alanine-synthesizing transaminase